MKTFVQLGFMTCAVAGGVEAKALECYEKLLLGSENMFSHSHQLVVERSEEALNLFRGDAAVNLSAVKIIERLMRQKDCRADEITNANLRPQRAHFKGPARPFTNVVYVDSNFGYFVLSQDMDLGINITFNRLD